MAARARGFTLIEIAIVLVIIGLLLGGILKGQELLTAARVRNIIQQQEQYKTAFIGFQDRYRNPPGDYAQATANIKDVAPGPCGTPNPDGNGNGNNRVEATGSENTLAWEHLSKAGFITVVYTCATTVGAGTSPRNRYEQPLEIVFDDQYAGTAPARHNLKTGGRIPSNLLAEVDRKIDDGVATTGEFRAALATGITATECYAAATGAWQADNPGNNCMGASLF
ncbi:MAG TPA: prepilin-type N-terminal cleavage/methylation domain-containing protein [Burkholderiales bacterium]|nr:prepilin-type N-terminal cleavage/methylation domain-containing protein [Burkholderiales bacterium]